MKYSDKNPPIQCMMTQSTCYQQTLPMAIKGVLWHSTGCDNPWLKRYVQPSDDDANRIKLLKKIGENPYKNDWNHIYCEAGLNCWIGKYADGTVGTVQTMPWNYRPWGCGSGNRGSCNSGWIQFEICEDNLKNKTYFNAIYKEACELTAYLCKLYNINPKGTVTINGSKIPTILCHQDSYQFGMGSNHGDVYNWFSKYNKTMENVRADVEALLKGASCSDKKATTADVIFNVGDVVRVVGTKYYSGESVPAWVRKKNWIVYSIESAKVIVNKSEDGENTIMSPFNAADLALVKSVTTTPIITDTDIIHVVKKGDTITNIAKQYGTTCQKIIEYNHIKNPNLIYTGQEIKIPSKSNVDVIKAGDIVRITGTKYYSGRVIPKWVRNINWIVYSAPKGSDRIIIHKSADGRYAIMSPINRRDLAVVKKH